DDRYDDGYPAAAYPAAGYADDEPVAERAAPVRDPEPLAVRRVTPARPLGLAPSVPGGSASSRAGGSAGASAAGLAVREPVPAPEPEPAPAPKQPYRITTLHPRTYNEARTIGERFRDGMPVIMNLTEMDDADAKRLVDFAAGLSFGLRGSIERVTAKVFLLSPQDVDVTAEDKARIREGGFFNQS
ncbi:MAG TPA: cell division protein SepF, partial [Blastococcus sp.]|nr:cell division protein SepF [Blastococcus sp.]